MIRNRSIMKRVMHGNELLSRSLPSMPLVEIVGYNRVLIENHACITTYDPNEVCVRVKFGSIHVQGEALHLAYMSPEKLVITGMIASIQLCNSCP